MNNDETVHDDDETKNNLKGVDTQRSSPQSQTEHETQRFQIVPLRDEGQDGRLAHSTFRT